MAPPSPDIRPNPGPGLHPALGLLLRELPLLLGIAAAAVLALRPGLSWFYPEGVDWEQYIDAADFLWRPEGGGGFPTWRQPLHAYLVGLLGSGSTYLQAAQLLGLGSTLAMVVAAGLLARALADSWAGAAAALVAASMGSTALAARLVTPYPLLGACAGLTLALAACSLRWRRWPLAALAGLFAGAAWATDLKGLIFAPLGLGLVAAALLLPWPRGRRWWLALLLAYGVGLAAPMGLDHWLKQGWGIQPMPLAEQVRTQRAQNLDRMFDAQLFEAPLREACAQEQALEMSRAALSNHCARAMLAENVEHMAAHTALPDFRSLWLLPLALLPALWARRSRKALLASSLATAATLLVPFLTGLVSMLWISHGVRYVLHLVVPAAALVPVAWSRLLGLPGFRWGWAQRAVGPLTLVVSLAWLCWVWPGAPPSKLLQLRGPNLPGVGEPRLVAPDPRLRLVDRLLSSLQPDDVVIDCASTSVRSFLLPVAVEVIEPLPHDLARCQSLVRSPPSTGDNTWLLARHVPDDPGKRWAMAPGLPADHGWTQLERIDARPHNSPWPACCDATTLWRWDGQSAPAPTYP